MNLVAVNPSTSSAIRMRKHVPDSDPGSIPAGRLFTNLPSPES